MRRAKFVTGSVAALRAKPEGGTAWLQGLRAVPYREAVEALCTLPGIGPKACPCSPLRRSHLPTAHICALIKATYRVKSTVLVVTSRKACLTQLPDPRAA